MRCRRPGVPVGFELVDFDQKPVRGRDLHLPSETLVGGRRGDGDPGGAELLVELVEVRGGGEVQLDLALVLFGVRSWVADVAGQGWIGNVAQMCLAVSVAYQPTSSEKVSPATKG
jgi:hypothetical protein